MYNGLLSVAVVLNSYSTLVCTHHIKTTITTPEFKYTVFSFYEVQSDEFLL
jgi:hypothetical protein